MRKIAALLLIFVLMVSLSGHVWAASGKIVTNATGYTSAEDVEHKIVNGIVVNWGARGETCSFLSPSALNYYYALDTDTWAELSEKDGGTGTSDAYTSQLYKALQSLMQTQHTNLQGYQDTRQYYQYTDCANNDSSLISSFYSGKTVASAWTGTTYNREHVWPKSKCINTNKAEDSADIMMLRATITSENSSRGNSAYGESSGYFDPGEAVRGDCARMVLYGYVRWGNTSKMWGTSGVMESLDILLKWMEEDPVDTWEMGRNDSVQSITGVRNVFVDYPEFAWLLFGQEIPEDMVTPSGNAAAEVPHTHSYTTSITAAATCTTEGVLTYTCACGDSYTESIPATGHKYESTVTAPSCTEQGFTSYTCACGDSYTEGIPATGHKYESTVTAPSCTEQGFTTYTCACGDSYADNYVPAAGHSDTDADWNCDICLEALCGHDLTLVYNSIVPSCTTAGYTGDTHCAHCGLLLARGALIPATGHRDDDRDLVCDDCGHTLGCLHENKELRNASNATCSKTGYTGDTYCAECGEQTANGAILPATGQHTYGDWVLSDDGGRQIRTCGECGRREFRAASTAAPTPTDPTPVDNTNNSGPIWIILAVVGATVAVGVAVFVIRKKKKR